ncbi:DMT family transporter [Haliangium ochraceum]|uniref:EamA domain-containing protein n=1 Tax=Haliangium ochraceum (strain DSM 14365 / JCM 11303 / SMP-2) TaxID=502025 RepID=D0LR72_HALO1|nr:DMT family transporter [Haliangium ochraceum]ACY15580.1 protein of unknown function DUF6 transmembrane [Haliangium ochraceum DSM 14365]
MRSPKLHGLIVAFVLLWNSGFIGAELGLPYADPFTLLFWRYLLLSGVLLLFLLVRQRRLWPGRGSVALAATVGVLAHGVWLACSLLALSYQVDAGIVALVVALQPLTTGALSGLAVGEPTKRHQWLGLLLGFCGVAFAVGARIERADSAPFAAYLLPLGAVAAITTASLLQRRQENAGRSLPLVLSLFYQSLATTLALAVPAVLFEGLATRWTATFAGYLLWLAVAVSLGAYAAMWRLLARIDATRVAGLFYLGPPVTAAMAWLAFGDPLRLSDVIGFAIACLGIVLLLRRSGEDAEPQSPSDHTSEINAPAR